MRVESLIEKDIDLNNSQQVGWIGNLTKKINPFVLRQNWFVISLPPSFYCATRARGSLLISTCFFSQNVNPFLHDLLTLSPVGSSRWGHVLALLTCNKIKTRADILHTRYLSFFLHGQNFWKIKCTPKNANFSR